MGWKQRYGIDQFEDKERIEVLKEGDKAPEFTTLDHTGKETRLEGLKGQKVWLWFFSSPGGGN
jgi:hypothetical protein